MNADTKTARSVSENPCRMCMPMGGILPFKGIENAMLIIHGSQGCATYMRRHMAEHFNEPIDVASSSITEQGTIYGGEVNLKQGLKNLIKLYEPEVVGILSTCLAETIGEDIARITSAFVKEQTGSSLPRLIPVSSPGYGGSLTEGYFQALYSIVENVSQESPPHHGINVIVPHISPADTREIKRILDVMGAPYTLLPDLSDTLDSPYSKVYKRIPPGGTPLASIEAMAGAQATIEFGETLPDGLSPGKYLRDQFGVSLYRLPLPMGIAACDKFLELLKTLTGNPVPEALKKERGRLQDAMIDSHKYNREGKAAVFGEPETVYGISRVLLENGVTPAIIATGSSNPSLKGLVEGLSHSDEAEPFILLDTDFAELRRYCAAKEVNLAIGNSDGRFLTEKEGLPLVRVGYPIHDRIGGQRILSVGYTGTVMLLDQITNTLLANKLNHYRNDLYQEFYRSAGAGQFE
jgi:nitrogenase molybdenum-iron protein NifN